MLAVALVLETMHWHWMWDDSIMRYANFLMDHGMVLYRDIIDMNMPGCFFIEGWVLHLLGTGDVAARCYEYTLLLTMTGAMIVIAWSSDWLAGLFAGVLFALIHSVDGPANSIQRDEIMTVFLLVCYALIFVSLRRRLPILLLPFGFVSGLAITLKPTSAPVGFVLMALGTFVLMKRKERVQPYVAYATVGIALAGLVVFQFFYRTHSFTDFTYTMQYLLPAYASMQHITILGTAKVMLNRSMLLLLVLTAAVTLLHRDWRNWERWALAFGVLFGAASYLAQRKGFNYHKYPFFAFFLLWAGLELTRAARERGVRRIIGIAGLSFGVLLLGPLYAYKITLSKQTLPIAAAIQHDLVALGGDKLQGKVQCMDIVAGCVEALDRLGLVQSTGFISDFMLFPPHSAPPMPRYREVFMQKLTAAKPSVIVLTDAWMSEPSSFRKVDDFPVFAQYLHDHYRLLLARSFAPAPRAITDNSYRIYVLASASPQTPTSLANGEAPPRPPEQ
ncbi:MAG: hypothetical protein ACRYGF_08495 [Janthinobacterium lividum]